MNLTQDEIAALNEQEVLQHEIFLNLAQLDMLQDGISNLEPLQEALASIGLTEDTRRIFAGSIESLMGDKEYTKAELEDVVKTSIEGFAAGFKVITLKIIESIVNVITLFTKNHKLLLNQLSAKTKIAETFNAPIINPEISGFTLRCEFDRTSAKKLQEMRDMAVSAVTNLIAGDMSKNKNKVIDRSFLAYLSNNFLVQSNIPIRQLGKIKSADGRLPYANVKNILANSHIVNTVAREQDERSKDLQGLLTTLKKSKVIDSEEAKDITAVLNAIVAIRVKYTTGLLIEAIEAVGLIIEKPV